MVDWLPLSSVAQQRIGRGFQLEQSFESWVRIGGM
jgi:hypothetical protein